MKSALFALVTFITLSQRGRNVSSKGEEGEEEDFSFQQTFISQTEERQDFQESVWRESSSHHKNRRVFILLLLRKGDELR